MLHNALTFESRIPHVYMQQSFSFSHSQHLKVSSISVLTRWPTVVHHYQKHDGGWGAGGIRGGLWLTSAGGEPHVSERGHVPSQAAGQHPAPAAAGRNGFHPAHCHRQQWVTVYRAGTRRAVTKTCTVLPFLSPSLSHTHTHQFAACTQSPA